MSVVPVASWVLLGSLLVACGERAGDAVVALPASDEPAQGGQAGQPGEPLSSGGVGAEATGGSSPDPGPSGLCAACGTSSECGDANDACIAHDGERFCGRDCDEQRDCPDGYSCVGLSNSLLWQCVPDGACAAPAAPPPALEAVRAHVLTRVNTERLAEARAPLQSSPCLDDLAQRSALDFARTDEPLGKYVKECDPIWPNCACGWWAEAEVTVARYGLDWETAVDRAFKASLTGGSQRFADAYLNASFHDVGIGFWLSGDEAWIALSFR